MTRKIERTGSFKKDMKRECKSHADAAALLKSTVTALANDQKLPRSMRDHALKGDWKGSRECHLKPDLLLIYQKHEVTRGKQKRHTSEPTLTLVRIGSHSELFD